MRLATAVLSGVVPAMLAGERLPATATPCAGLASLALPFPIRCLQESRVGQLRVQSPREGTGGTDDAANFVCKAR